MTDYVYQDPERFMSVVNEPDMATRFEGAADQPSRFVCEFLRFGLFGPDAKQEAIEIYRNHFLDLSDDERWSIFLVFKSIAHDIGPPAPIGFSLFWMHDPHTSIVSTAIIDFLSLGTEGDADLIWWAQQATDMINENKVENPAAVIGGILALGDDRVPALLAPLRINLHDGEAEIISNTASGFTYVSEIEFLLSWLEETVLGEMPREQNIFGHVAAGLMRRIFGRSHPYIQKGERPYPYNPEKDERRQPENCLEPEQVGRLFSDRLLNLEQLERAPRILPFVMQALGVKPRTSPETWADTTVQALYAQFR